MTDDATNTKAGGSPLLSEELGRGSEARCWCLRCRPLTLTDMRMAVCPSCGDKRCMHAADHRAPCAKDDLYAHNMWVQHNLAEPLNEGRERSAMPAGLEEICDRIPARAAMYARRSWAGK